jgi:hypothetical protein
MGFSGLLALDGFELARVVRTRPPAPALGVEIRNQVATYVLPGSVPDEQFSRRGVLRIGEEIKDAFVHYERAQRIHDDLVEFPSAEMILRDSLHLPWQAGTAKTESSKRSDVADS